MINFTDRVAIVTGAGAGLGRSHALGLAARGAAVVVNDMGAGADNVAAEIEAAGGRAWAYRADVSDTEAVADMIAQTQAKWGRIDILINNAGILRDKTFAKMDMADFRKVVDVHLIGSANCCHAVWPIMRDQGYGRIVLTASGSGLYGNFGQANYGAAKAAMVGLMNVLHLEGARDDIRINTLAPTAATAMTEGLLPQTALDVLGPETITPGVLYLASEDSPSRTILSAGGGTFAVTQIRETQGTLIQGEITPEAVAAAWNDITDATDAQDLENAFAQTRKYALRAAKAKGVTLDW
ncbi:SDR family NAD(P)-dependent oxidoreductase [uncultured Tateyamaria sp.]|uniref:SDR family NAD(P)-dependent oxidoreductase n=1 Tax=uncultured Tateyamaria sp. TaxID=455651 RepID=UPI00260F16B4|nr:SDR family NAD(P)-dependent oxidoreductase [uncultured Tateyamaria sp.]